MAFTLQEDTPVAGANAYVDVLYFTDYHATRGNAVPTTDTATIEAAIVRATGYLDLRHRYVGYRQVPYQDLEWPRQNAWDDRSNYITGVPPQVKYACCEYALRALQQDLLADPTRDETGKPVTETSEKVGGIETKKSYDRYAQYELPAYPFADLLLRQRGLIRPDGSGGIRVGSLLRG